MSSFQAGMAPFPSTVVCAEAHLRPRLAVELDRRRVLVAVDVDAAADLPVRVAVFLQAIREPTL